MERDRQQTELRGLDDRISVLLDKLGVAKCALAEAGEGKWAIDARLANVRECASTVLNMGNGGFPCIGFPSPALTEKGGWFSEGLHGLQPIAPAVVCIG